MRFGRIELFLNERGIGPLRIHPRAMGVPVLQNHGDRGGPTAVLALFYKRHIEPHSRLFLGRRLKETAQEEKQEQTESSPVHGHKLQFRSVRISEGPQPRR